MARKRHKREEIVAKDSVIAGKLNQHPGFPRKVRDLR